ncbi:3-oxoacyl-[acyl-carrier-protein] reductase [soil metagenome]
MTGRDLPPKGRKDSAQETLLPLGQSATGAAVEQLLEEVEADTEPRGQHIVVGGLRGRVALVTGASTGIGRAVARALARSGVHIAFNYLDDGEEDRLDARRTADELEGYGVRVLYRAVDCTDSNEVTRFVDHVESEMGSLFILVNNAGMGRDGALWRMSDEDWCRVLDTNLTGAFYFLRAVSGIFRRQEGGKVVNVSSVHAFRSEFGLANYAASKAGLLALTRAAALELGPSNVNVNAVAPGYIRTTRLTERVPSEILDEARERSALRRLGDPQDVAGAVLFLCSEAARHMTGITLPVDGGYLL